MRRAFLNWLPYFMAITVTVGISLSVWPGFMSWDSLHALREARFGVTGGCYPTMVSYIWRPIDWIHPGLMLVVQNGLFLLSLAHFLRLLNFSPRVSAFLVGAIAFSPAVFGPLLVVWKDTLVLAFFLLAIAALLDVQLRGGIAGLWIAALGLFFGTACRFNGFTAAIPLWGWLAWLILARRMRIVSPQSLVGVTAILLVVSFLPIYVFQSFRLTTFERLPRPTPDGVMIFDLIGTSHFARNQLLPSSVVNYYPSFDIGDLDGIYFPQHAQLSFAGLGGDKPGLKLLHLDHVSHEEIWRAWKDAVQHYPLAYLRHRLSVTVQLVIFRTPTVFYLTHNGVDPNDLGVQFRETRWTRSALRLVNMGGGTLFARVWVYYLFGALLLLILWVKKPVLWQIPTLILGSGFLYVVLFIPVASAADLCYNLFAAVAMMVGYLASYRAFFPKHLEKPSL
jgi:hypothetical protein